MISVTFSRLILQLLQLFTNPQIIKIFVKSFYSFFFFSYNYIFGLKFYTSDVSSVIITNDFIKQLNQVAKLLTFYHNCRTCKHIYRYFDTNINFSYNSIQLIDLNYTQMCVQKFYTYIIYI